MDEWMKWEKETKVWEKRERKTRNLWFFLPYAVIASFVDCVWGPIWRITIHIDAIVGFTKDGRNTWRRKMRSEIVSSISRKKKKKRRRRRKRESEQKGERKKERKNQINRSKQVTSSRVSRPMLENFVFFLRSFSFGKQPTNKRNWWRRTRTKRTTRTSRWQS
jgi:hypothetical protein